MSKWLTTDEAAARLGYHPNHLRRLLRAGSVQGHRGRNYRWQISEREVKRVKSLQTERGRYCPDSVGMPWEPDLWG